MPSTAILRFAYRRVQSELDIQFVTSRVYRYHAVPEEIAAGLARARSKGGYFNHVLRNHFACMRLSHWQEPDAEPA